MSVYGGITFGHFKAVAKKIRRRDGVSIEEAVKRAARWAKARAAKAAAAADPLACTCGRWRYRRKNPHCKHPECVAVEKEKRFRRQSAYAGSSWNW